MAQIKKGSTVGGKRILDEDHLADNTQQAHLAKNIGLEDTAGNFVANNIEGAMSELFTNVSSGKSLVGGAITDVDNSIVIPTDPTFQQLANAIGQISTGLISEISPGNLLIYTDSSIARSETTTFEKIYETKVLLSGHFRVSYTLYTSRNASNRTVNTRMYINGVPGEVKSHNSATPVVIEEDIVLKKNDIIEIHAKSYSTSIHAFVKDFSLGIEFPYQVVEGGQ